MIVMYFLLSRSNSIPQGHRRVEVAPAAERTAAVMEREQARNVPLPWFVPQTRPSCRPMYAPARRRTRRYSSPSWLSMSMTSPVESESRRAIRADMSMRPEEWKVISGRRELGMRLFIGGKVR